MAKAILVDTSKCTACRGCQVACKQWNELPAEKTECNGTYENPPNISGSTWTRVKFNEVEEGGKVKWLFAKTGCMHCTDATCMKVCPVGAPYRTSEGAVVVDQSKCVGCKYCVENCPFGGAGYDADKNVSAKCEMCNGGDKYDRVANGLEPACVKTCPPGALSFGDRDKMVATGKERVAELKTAGYKNARLYGETELGGLGVMYVLTEKPSDYGLPEDPKVPLSAVLWKDILKPLGPIAGGVATAAFIISFLANLGYKREAHIGEGEAEEGGEE